MCTNTKSNNNLFIIDYGLAVNYFQIHDAKLEFKGTPYFASNNMIMRGNLGPRDDLESLVYLLLYLSWGKLPWSQNLPVMSDDLQDHMELQRVVQQARDPTNLCKSRPDCEPEFAAMLSYLQGMPSSSTKKPEYSYIKKCLNAIKERKNFGSSLEWVFGYNQSGPNQTSS